MSVEAIENVDIIQNAVRLAVNEFLSFALIIITQCNRWGKITFTNIASFTIVWEKRRAFRTRTCIHYLIGRMSTYADVQFTDAVLFVLENLFLSQMADWLSGQCFFFAFLRPKHTFAEHRRSAQNINDHKWNRLFFSRWAYASVCCVPAKRPMIADLSPVSGNGQQATVKWCGARKLGLQSCRKYNGNGHFLLYFRLNIDFIECIEARRMNNRTNRQLLYDHNTQKKKNAYYQRDCCRNAFWILRESTECQFCFFVTSISLLRLRNWEKLHLIVWKCAFERFPCVATTSKNNHANCFVVGALRHQRLSSTASVYEMETKCLRHVPLVRINNHKVD